VAKSLQSPVRKTRARATRHFQFPVINHHVEFLKFPRSSPPFSLPGSPPPGRWGVFMCRITPPLCIPAVLLRVDNSGPSRNPFF
jgi:hypothetical protein